MHFLAHGMGLVSHEAPRLTARMGYDAYDAERPLEAGMVISVETTLQHPKRGFIKLEDTVAVTDTGFEIYGEGGRGWNRAGTSARQVSAGPPTNAMSIPVTAEHARGQAATRAWLVPAVFVWFAATAWLRPLALPDEGRYVGVALEMLWSGDWLVPTLDTLPYFHKPPLFYWLTAASLGVFGINEWAARLPSLLAATGAAFAVYLFVRRWAGERQALLALAVLATTPFFFGGAQFANLDMLVAACIACTILCAADAVLAAEGDRPRRSTLVAAYAFAALGILAKGLDRRRHPGPRHRRLARGHGADGHDPAPRVAAGAGAVRRDRRAMVRPDGGAPPGLPALLLRPPSLPALYGAGLQQSPARSGSICRCSRA